MTVGTHGPSPFNGSGHEVLGGIVNEAGSQAMRRVDPVYAFLVSMTLVAATLVVYTGLTG